MPPRRASGAARKGSLLPARSARCYPLGVETGIAYALAAALFWGTSPVLVKRGLRHSNVSAAVLLQQVGSVLTLVLIMVLPFGEATLRMPWSAAGVFVSVGLVGSFLGRTFVLKGIDEIGASKAQSISNSAPLLTAVYAIVLLGETATPIILIGVVLIVTGLLIITRGTPDDKVTGRPVSYRAFLNPLLSIIFFGFGPILKKVAMLAGGTAVPGALITHLTGLLLIFLFGRVLHIEWREGIRVSGDSYFFLLLSGFVPGRGLHPDLSGGGPCPGHHRRPHLERPTADHLLAGAVDPEGGRNRNPQGRPGRCPGGGRGVLPLSVAWVGLRSPGSLYEDARVSCRRQGG